MKRRLDEWPWNRPWPWLLFIAPIAVFVGVIWIPMGSCSMYPEGFQGDTSCYFGPVAGFLATWIMTAVCLVIVTALAAGLVHALVRSHKVDDKSSKY